MLLKWDGLGGVDGGMEWYTYRLPCRRVQCEPDRNEHCKTGSPRWMNMISKAVFLVPTKTRKKLQKGSR